ncbi:MAG: adenylate/guanylate cyclase domain-containing protein [Geminicoccaceae bacterium]|nr:adenylate/guanylate cyclase domain-containing protein [Geminicoccaceae bacterium]MCB9966216.1 adenylate/guanylate cyclase domain-containing protein [Geminicoccaceae bacterium]
MSIESLREQLFLTAEIEAERFLAILRLTAVLVLALALGAALLAVDGPPPAAQRQIVVAGSVMAVYAGIGLISYLTARPGRFRRWMPWLFTTADCALVLFNVATTVLNIGAPPATVWVFPAIWLAPLVLVFGSLHYRPWLQGYAAAVLVGGLVLLLAGLPQEGTLERILPLLDLPPTVVRIVLLGLAGLVLVLAAARRKALLERAIEEAVERTNLARYLPPEIAALLAAGDVEQLRRGWDVRIGILVVDIRGFTSRSEHLAPPELSTFLGTFRHHVVKAALTHRGVVDKFVGDSAIVVFGVPEGHADDARRTLDCARHLLRRVAAWSDRLTAAGEAPVRIGIGAHFGPAFAGAVGDSSRLEFTVLGDTVNVAARLEQITRETDGGLVASAALVAAAGEGDHWLALPTHAVRGREQPIDILHWQGEQET